MHKNILWLILAILCIYISLVFCEESTAVQDLQSKDLNDLLRNDMTVLEEEARTRRKHRYHLYSLWGFYGLAIAYLIKIKVVVVAFFVGSAVYLGLRYWWPHKCAGGEIYKEGSVVLDHPPSFTHYDHIPYALDHDQYHNQNHHYDSGSFGSSGPTSYDPYAAYSSHSFSEPDGPITSNSYTEADGPPGSFSSNAPTFRRKRSNRKYSQDSKDITGTLKNMARQMVINEEQIGEFMFAFLGLDTNACRRRFICEMEFKSKANPLTSMGFRVIGRSFFAKYINSQNPLRKANSFKECAAVNADCVFIENNEETMPETEQKDHNAASDKQVETSDDESEATTEGNALDSSDVIQKENESNLRRELGTRSYRRRLRGDRHLKLL